MREFDVSLRSNERNASAHLGRGIAFQYFGTLPEAERDYRRALELAPALSEAHNALGQLLALTSRPEEAILHFDRALSDMLYKDAYLVRCNKGQVLHAMGRKDEGLAELERCVSLAPRYCRGHRELGRVKLEDGKPGDALASFRRYAELCPKEPDAWYQLGVVEMKLGDPEKARDAFERCAELPGEEPLLQDCRKNAQVLR